jgi:hypothetical protein
MALNPRLAVEGRDAGVHLGAGIYIFTDSTTPVDGTSGTGAGITAKSSICMAEDTGEIYTNTGTKASPTWTNQT